MLQDAQSEVVFSDLIEFCEAEGLQYYIDSERNQLLICLRAGCYNLHVHVGFNGDPPLVRCRFYAPNRVPEHRRLAMSDAITRVNHSFAAGAFVMDMEDGELAFHIGILTSRSSLSHAQLGQYLELGCMMIKFYLPKFERVMLHDDSPEDILSPKALAEDMSGSDDR